VTAPDGRRAAAPDGRAAAAGRRAGQQTSNAVLAMFLFVVSESMFFMGFLAIYASSYASHPVWPPRQITPPPVGLPTAAAAVLLASGAVMAAANRAARRGEARSLRWVRLALVLAVGYAVLLAISYQGLGFGVHDGIYASLFYVISAITLAHAIGGAVFFVILLVASTAGELAVRRDPVQAATIYWCFVLAIGLVTYLVFYLGNAS
jgi:cytochrome c oxidase subunit 3